MNEELTNKQRLFCQEYVKSGMNGTQAYMQVYKTKKEETAMTAASRMLRNVKVKNYIQELQEKVEDESIMDIKERKRWLEKIINGTIKEKVVLGFKKDDNGSNVVIEGEISSKLKTRMDAMEMLNKMDGVYVMKHKIGGDSDNPLNVVDLSHLSTEEIRELLKVEDKE